jgi:hypothetical protein
MRATSVAIRRFGVPVNPLLKELRVHTDDLIRVDPGHGIRVEGNDLLLDASQLLPPPAFQAGSRQSASIAVRWFRHSDWVSRGRFRPPPPRRITSAGVAVSSPSGGSP